MKTRDFDIITHIKKYCIDIENTVNRFGNNLTCFSNDIDYRNSVCMSILQIGELTGNLSDEFRRATKEIIYWPSVKGMCLHINMGKPIMEKFGKLLWKIYLCCTNFVRK